MYTCMHMCMQVAGGMRSAEELPEGSDEQADTHPHPHTHMHTHTHTRTRTCTCT